MKYSSLHIALVSTFPPTQCGIATYACDLIDALQASCKEFTVTKIELGLENETIHKEKIVIDNIKEEHYYSAAEFINSTDIDLVDIQHEFKIYGKPDGENILILLNQIKKPIVTTLHTITPNLNEQRKKVFSQILYRSDLLHVFSTDAKTYVAKTYKVPDSKIKVIPHGIPSVSYKRPSEIEERNKINTSIVFVAAGHLREAKGYEIALKALYSLKKEIPSFHFLILGADHPQNKTSPLYRELLLGLVNDLGLRAQVTFIDKYLELNELIKYIQVADVGLFPYTRVEQSSSGVLALMIACGRPIVSTPFQFAQSYLTESSGTLSNSFTASDFAAAIKALIAKKGLWDAMCRYNYILGQSWSWQQVANFYLQGYNKALS